MLAAQFYAAAARAMPSLEADLAAGMPYGCPLWLVPVLAADADVGVLMSLKSNV